MHPTRIALALLFAVGLASSQTPPTPKAAVDIASAASQELDHQLAYLEREFVPAAEAMPEASYNFAPTNGEFKGVKTFAQQVRHVASANYFFAAAIAGEKAPAEIGGENGPETLKTKAEIIKYLKDSYAYSHKVFAGITDANATSSMPAPWGQGTTSRLGLATLTVSHAFDHYGQMVVYLRMNGIVPPASRKQ